MRQWGGGGGGGGRISGIVVLGLCSVLGFHVSCTLVCLQVCSQHFSRAVFLVDAWSCIAMFGRGWFSGPFTTFSLVVSPVDARALPCLALVV